jgi:DNA-binding MarR family transcriptional regulator
MMAELSLALHTDHITEIIRQFIRLKPRLKTVLPEDLVRMRARLEELRPEGKAKNGSDYALLYSVGIVLSRQRDPLTMGELSKALDVPLSTATRVVDWFVRTGYVGRLPDPGDRRIVRVALTKTGREFIKTREKFVRQHVEHILRRFTAEERESMIVLLRKLVEILESEGE